MSGSHVCAEEDVPATGAIEVRLDGTPPIFAIILRHEGQLRAFENSCPHAGRPLNFAPNRFLFTPEGHLVCAVHGASFECGEGRALAGPCVGAALRSLACRVEAGQVYLSAS